MSKHILYTQARNILVCSAANGLIPVMNKQVCIFGGTGFIGKMIVYRLCAQGWRVRIATRHPQSAYDLKPSGVVGQVAAIAADLDNPASAIDGCDAVINCIGILFERKKQTFQRLHVDFPERLAQACAEKNIDHLIHISALGVDTSQSRYAKSKAEGENRVMDNMPSTTILRPSIVFGPEDGFFNLFASLSSLLPVLPLIGGGHTKFQPVYVGDVADAVMACLSDNKTKGCLYELGGPEVDSFKDLLKRLARHTGRSRVLVPLPFCVAKIEAFFLQFLPKPLLTPDQVESLRYDNQVSGNHPILADLGITPTAMDAILPTYLARYRKRG